MLPLFFQTMAFIEKSSWQEIEIEGIIRTLAVNYSPILID